MRYQMYNNKEAVETLLNIMDMSNCGYGYAGEREWLKRVLHSIKSDGLLKDIKSKYLNRIMSMNDDDYFSLRNEIRDDATILVNELASDELVKLKKKKEKILNELKTIDSRLIRFTKWRVDRKLRV